MRPADLALVNDLFNCVAPAAAAEMKGRVLAVLRGECEHWKGGPTAERVLREAMSKIEALPLSKETTT